MVKKARSRLAMGEGMFAEVQYIFARRELGPLGSLSLRPMQTIRRLRCTEEVRWHELFFSSSLQGSNVHQETRQRGDSMLKMLGTSSLHSEFCCEFHKVHCCLPNPFHSI